MRNAESVTIGVSIIDQEKHKIAITLMTIAVVNVRRTTNASTCGDSFRRAACIGTCGLSLISLCMSGR